MHPNFLFLERCEQLRGLVESGRQIDIIDIGGRLRQLLLDKHNLAASVNANKIRLRFDVGYFSDGEDPYAQFVVFVALLDAIDPYTDTDKPRHFRTLDLDRFLAHHVMSINGNRVLIKDVIRFASNVAGGVHYDPKPKSEYDLLNEFSRAFSIGGLPAGISTLKAIGRVSLRGLQPLIADVKARCAPGGAAPSSSFG